MNASNISRIALCQYGFMALPLAFAGLPLYIHAPDYYATSTGIPLAVIGTIILAVRLFDAIQDPFIGLLSNRYREFRQIIMIVSLVIMGIGFVMLFNPPQDFTRAWFAICLILTTTAFSILTINLNAMGSLWSRNSQDKVAITGWREAIGLAGLLGAAILPTFVNLKLYGLILSGLLTISGFFFWTWYKVYKSTLANNESSSPSRSFKELLDIPIFCFFLVYGLSMLASTFPAVLILFFVRDLLNAEYLTGLFLFLYFLSGAFSMPLWQALSRKTDKLTAWIFAMGLAVITFVWAYSLGSGDIYAYATICILSGLALGAELALPPALLSELIDLRKRQPHTSFYFSLHAFLFKGSMALGSGIAFFIIGQSSFTPEATNSPDSLDVLSFTYALLPCIIKCVAILTALFLFKSILNGKTNEKSVINHNYRYHHGN